MHRRVVAIIFLSLLASVWPHAAVAEHRVRETHTPRQGWILGLVVGSASGKFSVQQGERSATSSWVGGGRVLRGRVGWFARSNVLLTAEYGVWRRAVDGADSVAAEEGASSEPGWTEPTDRYLGSAVLAAQLYPLDAGFSLKAGLGYGRVAADADDEAGVTLTGDEWGALLLMGAAWEFSIAHDISIALGADVGRIDAGDGVSGNFAHFTASFHLHLAEGIPRDWF